VLAVQRKRTESTGALPLDLREISLLTALQLLEFGYALRNHLLDKRKGDGKGAVANVIDAVLGERGEKEATNAWEGDGDLYHWIMSATRYPSPNADSDTKHVCLGV
jgi:hypothetical protein